MERSEGQNDNGARKCKKGGKKKRESKRREKDEEMLPIKSIMHEMRVQAIRKRKKEQRWGGVYGGCISLKRNQEIDKRRAPMED
jgi:hypothetical protein